MPTAEYPGAARRQSEIRPAQLQDLLEIMQMVQATQNRMVHQLPRIMWRMRAIPAQLGGAAEQSQIVSQHSK